MEHLDIDASVVLALALLASIRHLVRAGFTTLRICLEEYDEFRAWLRRRRQHASHGCGMGSLDEREEI